MSKKRMQNIRIEWKGPYSLEDIGYDEKDKKYKLKNAMLNSNEGTQLDYGVYQIYGVHPVYGSNVLLYIGQANHQTFAKRISQEGWEYNQDYKNVEIYVGYIYNSSEKKFDTLGNDDVWEKAIHDAERMLIYSHEPARNSSNILSIRGDEEELKEMENIRVFNYGSCKSLMPEVSGEIWIKEFDDKLFGAE